jgi:hypothetical protein
MNRSGPAAIALLAGLMATCRSPPPPQPTPAGSARTIAEWRFQSESHWLVARIAEAMLAMGDHANGRAPAAAARVRSVSEGPAAAQLLRLRLDFEPGLPLSSLELEVRDHLFSPEAYAPLAARLLPAGALPAQPREWQAGPLLAALLNPTFQGLELANQLISKALGDDFLNPSLHEHAALLLATLAFRENADEFADSRVTLCRLTAHLAFAAALRGPASLGRGGELARLALLTLVGRQRDSVDRLERLAPGSPAERAWASALRLAAAADWRTLPKPERATLLERLLYLNAVGLRLGPERLLKSAESLRREPVTDWRRIMLAQGSSLEACSRFAATGLEEEKTEVLGIWTAYRGKELDPEVWSSALGMSPAWGPIVTEEGATTVRVIDLGLWSAFEQRHVFHQLNAELYCLKTMWYLPEQAEAHVDQVAHQASSLPLYPLLSAVFARDDAEWNAAAREVLRLCQRQPELITAANWARLVEYPAAPGLPREMPNYRDWFVPVAPFGTVLDSWHRWGKRIFRPFPTAESLEPLVGLAPWNEGVRIRRIWSSVGRNPPLEPARAELAELAEYDIRALETLAEAARDQPQEQARLYKRLCDLNSDHCVAYARALVEQKREEEAAAAYRSWAATARDAVRVTHDIDWLVNYEYDHGRPKEAFQLARQAAATYSAAGLYTLARLLEKDGKLDEAEAHFRTESERYDSVGLFAFHRRHLDNPRYKRAYEAKLRETFPGGMEKVTLEDFSGPPRDGVLVDQLRYQSMRHGLRRGVVIVALDGVRVHTVRQFYVVQALKDEDGMELIVWQLGAYGLLKPSAERRDLGVWLKDYQA